ncbi:C-C motif chemokine 4, partial [Clarias magur]
TNKPGACCFKFQLRKIPVKLITTYIENGRGCLKDGVIFIMMSGRRVCADPGLQWVKDHMDTVDQLIIPVLK